MTRRVTSCMGSVGLLSVASACFFADRQDALAAPQGTSKTSSSDCVSTTALLVFRGLGAGLAWTIGVDGYALAGMTDAEWKKRMATRPDSSVAREAARSLGRLSVRNMLGFASFLGIFGGGFTAGLAILPGELRNPRTLVTAAFLCGSASMALHYFIPSEGNKNEGVVVETSQ